MTIDGAGDTGGGVMIRYLPVFLSEVIAGGWPLFKGVRTPGGSCK
jgi:hypothetical protein